MNAAAIRDQLRAVEIFAGLDDDELELIAATAVPVRVAAGASLIRDGTAPEGVYVVLSGTIEVIRICERVAIVPEGGIVGDIAALRHGGGNVTLIAGTHAVLLHVSDAAATSLLAQPA